MSNVKCSPTERISERISKDRGDLSFIFSLLLAYFQTTDKRFYRIVHKLLYLNNNDFLEVLCKYLILCR